MFIGGGFGPWKHPPVHETLTLAALIASDYKLDPKTTYNKAIQEYDYDNLEFLRGIVWNDDPACMLFNDEGLFAPKSDNFSRGLGKDWFVKFSDGHVFDLDCTKNGWFGHKNIIARSHFGDLQFLHSMADEPGELPEETKRKIINWIEIMYKLAIGEISAQTRLRDVELTREDGDHIYPLRDLFDAATIPTHDCTIHSFLTADHAYVNVKHDRRALGSCMHVIQDSYARGHCHRPIRDDGPPKRFGVVENFHSFRGQDAEAHTKYDFGAEEGLEDHDCSDISRFEEMDGCTDAIEQCTKLINFWCRKASWEEVLGWLRDEVFAVSKDATASNTNVD